MNSKPLNTTNEWKLFFKKKGVSNDVIEKYLEYIYPLLSNKVPIIFEFDHLSLLLGRQIDYLASVINSPDNHYTSFNLLKRTGGSREITIPYPALLEMQYWIYNNILKKISIDSSAHGFAKKKSIITNAKVHIGQEEILKLDLKDFFPSININRIIHIFKSLGYSNHISFYLASICSYNKSLPQGSPTSPQISNIVAKKLDKRLISLSKKLNLKYTRYADDLTFSGKHISVKTIEYITEIIIDEGFEVNKHKTRLYKKPGKRIITGVSVKKDSINIPSTYKRNLKQELYYIFKYGYESHISKKKIKKYNYLLSLIGKVNYWLSIEPDNHYAINAKIELEKIYSSIYFSNKKRDA
ncbi:reverse transcriptase family protein [Flavobacterium sp. C4GT6]|uniref:reverse transcriptase family protein n=1 Tax=Flavobacterium sp. C4GT6 TaxID=3103818 RepID=UPI002ED4A36C